MENILLVFLDDLKDVEGINKIIDEFDKREYKMYLYDNIKNSDFDFSELPSIVEFYKNQYENVNKVVVLSNLRDLLFAWYRCYNSVATDFIYFIDREEISYFDFKDRHYEFYKNLSSFMNIDDERINGKIYLNINLSNYNNISNYILVNNNFSYFDNFENFSFDKKTSKEIIIKEYIYNKYNYLFEYSLSNNNKQTIKLNETVDTGITISDAFLSKVLSNSYIIPFLTILFYKQSNSVLTRALTTLFQKLKGIEKKKQNDVFNLLFRYVNDYKLDLKEKVYIASLLVNIHDGTGKLTEFLVKEMLKGKVNINHISELVSNLMFYQSNDNLSLYDDYYLDIRRLFDNCLKSVVNENQSYFKKSRKNLRHNENKMVIVVDQLLSSKHSPTKLIVDYIKGIKKYYPHYDIKLFIEDNLYNINPELIPFFYSSLKSETLCQMHKEYLDAYEVELIYPDITKEKSIRVMEFIKKIFEYSPTVILTTSKISILNHILYDYFPIVYITTGGINLTNADINLTGDKRPWIKIGEITGLFHEKSVINFEHGFSFQESNIVYNKSSLGLNDNQFVMATVGNRLSSELPENFIELIVRFLENNADTAWILIGTDSIEDISKNYIGLLNDKRILFIDYEDNLSSFYKICDVYVNPPTAGRGFSIAMAMNEGVPIITLPNSGGTRYVGEENYCGYNLEDYREELIKLYQDDNYRKAKSVIMKQRIKELFSIRHAVDQIINSIKTAHDSYLIRHDCNNRIEEK